MKKKLLLLILVVFTLPVLFFGYGVYVGKYQAFPYTYLHQLKEYYILTQGRGGQNTATPSWLQDTNNQTATDGLGYVGTTKNQNKQLGVVKNDTAQAQPGINLYVSGHKAAAYLMDMKGNILHRWERTWDDTFDQEARQPADLEKWRRVHTYPNGDLIVMWPRNGIARIDRNSNVKWAHTLPAHHNIIEGGDGRLYTLTSQWKSAKKFGYDRSMIHDSVTILEHDGDTVANISIYKAIKNSDNQALFDYVGAKQYRSSTNDAFHVNDIEYISQAESKQIAHPAFAPGNLLLSMRRTNTLAVLDPEKKEIVWASATITRGQHHPTITKNGNILVFDNDYRVGENPKKSRVAIIDPHTLQVVWSFGPKRTGHNYYSNCCSVVHQLPNENILVTITEEARAVEVTPDGDVVWAYHNRHKTGENEVGVLFSVKRFSPDYFSWLDI